MMQHSMEYEHPERRDDGGRERISRSEFEHRVRLATTHMAVSLVLVNRDADGWEADFEFSLEDYTERKRRNEIVPESLDQLTPEEQLAVERVRAELAGTVSMTLARRFDIVSEPPLFDDAHDVGG
jgi:hypothetical protein